MHSEHTPEAGKLLDLNKATADQLRQHLTGVGQKLAERIVDYRQEHGAFGSVWELANVPGIGQRLLERIVEQLTVKRESLRPASFFERDADQLLHKSQELNRLNPGRSLGNNSGEVELQVSEGASKENEALYDVFASGGMGAALAEAISSSRAGVSKTALVHVPSPFTGRTLRMAELRNLSQPPSDRSSLRMLAQETQRPLASLDETPYAFATAEKPVQQDQDIRETERLAHQDTMMAGNVSVAPSSLESGRVAEAVPAPVTMIPESRLPTTRSLAPTAPQVSKKSNRGGTLLLLGLAAGLALSAGLSWKWLSQKSWAEQGDLSQLQQNLGTVRDEHQQTRDEVDGVKARARALESKAAQVDELERRLAQEQQSVREMQAGMQKMGRDVTGLREGLRKTQRAVDARVWQIDQSSIDGKTSSAPVADTEGPYHPKLPAPTHYERVPHP